MRTIIGDVERRRRDQLRKENQRREAGCQVRADYLATAETRREHARALRANGHSLTVIAKALGVSRSAVSGYGKN